MNEQDSLDATNKPVDDLKKKKTDRELTEEDMKEVTGGVISVPPKHLAGVKYEDI